MKNITAKLLLLLALLPLVAGPALAAWPTTPLTTYVSGTTPAIKAADLNAFQTAINKGFLGEYTYKGIVVDGTGGAGTTPNAGSVTVSRTATGTSAPTTQLAGGELNQGDGAGGVGEHQCRGGILVRGLNVYDDPGVLGGATHTGAGLYDVIFHAVPTNPLTGACFVTPKVSFPRFTQCYTSADGAGRLKASVFIWNSAGTATDTEFHVVAYAE
jgi:hypothetical protein